MCAAETSIPPRMELPARARTPKQNSPNLHHNVFLLCYNTPLHSPADTNYFMRQSGAHSLCSPLSSSAARKFTTSKALPFPVPSIVYNQASPPTACTNHRQPTGLLSCFILFPDSPAPSACAFSSGNSIISLDTPFPPASAQSGTVPPP